MPTPSSISKGKVLIKDDTRPIVKPKFANNFTPKPSPWLGKSTLANSSRASSSSSTKAKRHWQPPLDTTSKSFRPSAPSTSAKPKNNFDLSARVPYPSPSWSVEGRKRDAPKRQSNLMEMFKGRGYGSAKGVTMDDDANGEENDDDVDGSVRGDYRLPKDSRRVIQPNRDRPKDGRENTSRAAVGGDTRLEKGVVALAKGKEDRVPSSPSDAHGRSPLRPKPSLVQRSADALPNLPTQPRLDQPSKTHTGGFPIASSSLFPPLSKVPQKRKFSARADQNHDPSAEASGPPSPRKHRPPQGSAVVEPRSPRGPMFSPSKRTSPSRLRFQEHASFSVDRRLGDPTQANRAQIAASGFAPLRKAGDSPSTALAFRSRSKSTGTSLKQRTAEVGSKVRPNVADEDSETECSSADESMTMTVHPTYVPHLAFLRDDYNRQSERLHSQLSGSKECRDDSVDAPGASRSTSEEQEQSGEQLRSGVEGREDNGPETMTASTMEMTMTVHPEYIPRLAHLRSDYDRGESPVEDGDVGKVDDVEEGTMEMTMTVHPEYIPHLAHLRDGYGGDVVADEAIEEVEGSEEGTMEMTMTVHPEYIPRLAHLRTDWDKNDDTQKGACDAGEDESDRVQMADSPSRPLPGTTCSQVGSDGGVDASLKGGEEPVEADPDGNGTHAGTENVDEHPKPSTQRLSNRPKAQSAKPELRDDQREEVCSVNKRAKKVTPSKRPQPPKPNVETDDFEIPDSQASNNPNPPTSTTKPTASGSGWKQDLHAVWSDRRISPKKPKQTSLNSFFKVASSSRKVGNDPEPTQFVPSSQTQPPEELLQAIRDDLSQSRAALVAKGKKKDEGDSSEQVGGEGDDEIEDDDDDHGRIDWRAGSIPSSQSYNVQIGEGGIGNDLFASPRRIKAVFPTPSPASPRSNKRKRSAGGADSAVKERVGRAGNDSVVRSGGRPRLLRDSLTRSPTSFLPIASPQKEPYEDRLTDEQQASPSRVGATSLGSDDTISTEVLYEIDSEGFPSQGDMSESLKEFWRKL